MMHAKTKSYSTKLLVSLLIVELFSGLFICCFAVPTTVSDESERFQEIHDFDDLTVEEIEVTFLGTFLAAVDDELIEVSSKSDVSNISDFSGMYIRDIETDFDSDRTRNGVLAYLASRHGISVLYFWGDRRQDFHLDVDAEKGLGFNPEKIALSPSGQFLYIYDPINGIYSVDLEYSFSEYDQRFIPDLLNDSVRSWPFDYGSPMADLEIDSMTGTNQGIILGGDSGLFYFDESKESWTNTTLTYQGTKLEVFCSSFMPPNNTVFVGVYGGIEKYQIVGGNISSLGQVALPENEWDAIYGINYDWYFSRLYAGFPDGLYVFFTNNNTQRFYSQEAASWDGFSPFSITALRHKPELLYFGTLGECYVLDISIIQNRTSGITTTTNIPVQTTTETKPGLLFAMIYVTPLAILILLAIAIYWYQKE